MDTIRQDVRFAIRSLRKNAGTSAIAILCLAFGIGASTAIYSVVRAVLLASLPYRDPERLVQINETYVAFDRNGTAPASPDNVRDWLSQSHSFDDMASYSPFNRILGDVAEPEYLRGIRSTANLLALLGARPLIGRVFTPADTGETLPLVVVSEGLWRRRFGADSKLIGTQITLTGIKHTVIGVMPREFDFPLAPLRNETWVLDRTMTTLKGRANYGLQVVGRLRPNVDSATAGRDLNAIAARLEKDYPTQQGRGVAFRSLRGQVLGKVEPALLVLLASVGVLLLIACANVATLLLVRGLSRRREVAIRMALGAGRSRVVLQFLTESVILAVVGGVLGLIVAWVGLQLLLSLASESLPRSADVGLNTPVLFFALVASTITGVAVGLTPAVRASRLSSSQALNEMSGRTSDTRAQRHAFSAIIVGEIALSVVLLVGAGLVLRGFTSLMATDPGFRPEGVLTFHLSPPPSQPGDTTRYTAFFAPAVERLRALPGVRVVSLTSRLPIQEGSSDRFFTIPGRPVETDRRLFPYAQFRVISGGYFAALSVPIIAGREFNDQDARNAPPVVIVNAELVRQYFGGENVLGRQIAFGSDPPTTIVGVVKSVRQFALDQPPRAEVYVPAAQTPNSVGTMTFVILAAGSPSALAPSVRTIMREFAPRQPVFQLETMSSVVGNSVATRKILLVLLSIIASVAVSLSMAGLFGVLSYAVSRRRRELSIRMALGASPTAIASMIGRDAVFVVGVGLALGTIAAFIVIRSVRALLFGVSVTDPLTFGSVVLLVGIVAVCAATIPTLRAARVDPLEVTKSA
jgi:predicted permease